MAVTGKLIELSMQRLVFAGRSDKASGYFLAFRSHEGDDTKIRISDEAGLALIEALNACDRGVDQFPHREEWVPVGP